MQHNRIVETSSQRIKYFEVSKEDSPGNQRRNTESSRGSVTSYKPPRYVDIRQHYTINMIEAEQVCVVKTESENMYANFVTKKLRLSRTVKEMEKAQYCEH